MFHRLAGRTAGVVGVVALSSIALTPTTTIENPSKTDKNYTGFSASRPLKFWYNVLPIFLHYKYLQYSLDGKPDQVRNKEFEILHRKYSQIILDLILEMRGIYIKFGQVGAMRPDIFPDEYRSKFRMLLDSVPPLDGDESIEIVEKALSKKIDQVFSCFNPIAIGAASIGQVHRATLLDGREVVVKIKYPTSKSLFSLDFETFHYFAMIASPEQLPAMSELRTQFLGEFDFERECWALNVIGENMRKAFPNKVVVPKPIPAFCNADIIVMDFIPGVRLLDGILHNYEKKASMMGVPFADLVERQGQFTRREKVQMGLRFSLAFVGDGVKRILYTIFNYSPLRLVFGALRVPEKLIDEKRIFDLLLDVHGHQILVDRFFQGDPHLGNILLIPDKRLGLIDFGQTKSISKKDARCYAMMLKLLKDDGDREALLKLAGDVGFTTEKNDPYVLYKTLQILLDNDSIENCEGQNLQQFMEKLNKMDKTREIPEQYVFAVRAAILLRGIGSLMGFHGVSLAKRWEKFADKAINFPVGADEDDILTFQKI